MKLLLALGSVLVFMSAVPRAAAADDSDREHRWQFSVPVTFTSGSSYDSQEGTSVDVDKDVGFGFGFGYNFSKKLMFGVDFTWINANYNAHVVTDANGDGRPDSSIDVAGTLDAANLQFVAQYNILSGRITPFLRGSIGWTWIDSNIPSGPVQGGCWWDPWYGYICNTWQPTFSDSEFAYGVAAGVRAELGDRFFLEASYNILWIDFSKAGTQDFDGVRLNMGWTF
ncbi:MAG TPA: outer membrane beta-barrel protein [Candidatus Polarisedimenticolaceae bacterium]|nr:outer membrane beta-barrel protein [Candidatus Polarisedimenticolaceae bacterium]